MKRYFRYGALLVLFFGISISVLFLSTPPFEQTVSTSAEDAFWSGERVLVNINTASPDELCTLPQIGEKRALAIVEYRETSGAFGSVEELCEVDGISDGILNAIREYITT